MNSKKVLRVLVLVVVLKVQFVSATTYIAFRYDDFSADRPNERQNNPERQKIWEAEQTVDSLFDKFGFPYTIAVIPKRSGISFAEDQEKIEFIKHAVRAGRVEVAQHGLSHINHAKENHKPGEFLERNYKSQLQDIIEGREILLKVFDLDELYTFVPPWNGWTKATAKILKKVGFKILSADSYYYYKSAQELTVIPFTMVPAQLEPMVEKSHLPQESIIIVNCHEFDFTKFPGLGSYYFGIERFEKLLQKLSTMPQVEIVTFRQLANRGLDLSIERFRQTNVFSRLRSFWAKLLPKRLWLVNGKQEIYYKPHEHSQMLLYLKTATVIFLAVLLAIGLLSRYLLNLVLTSKWSFKIDIFMTLAFCISIISVLSLSYRGYHISAIRLIPSLPSSPFVVALILRIFRQAKCRNKIRNESKPPFVTSQPWLDAN